MHPTSSPSCSVTSAAGIVESVGEGVTEVAPGDFVILILAPRYHGVCRACRLGDALAVLLHAGDLSLRGGVHSWCLPGVHQVFSTKAPMPRAGASPGPGSGITIVSTETGSPFWCDTTPRTCCGMTVDFTFLRDLWGHAFPHRIR